MRSERRDIRLARAGRYHHRDGIAGHDAQENEHDDRDAGERGERHQETPEDRQRDHRCVTTCPIALRAGAARAGGAVTVIRGRAQAAGDTSVG